MVHALYNIFGRQFEAFLDENEVLPANGGPCNGRIALSNTWIFTRLSPGIHFKLFYLTGNCAKKNPLRHKEYATSNHIIHDIRGTLAIYLEWTVKGILRDVKSK